MKLIDSLLGFVHTHQSLLLLIVSASVVCLLIINLYLLIRMGRLARMSKSAIAAVAESPVGDTIELDRRLGKSEQGLVLLNERHDNLDNGLARSVQGIGLVRFDAFPDVGGEQSFALALLDRRLNGVVLSSLYGRNDSRMYAKVITDGRSQHTLSDEEKEAVKQAGNSLC